MAMFEDEHGTYIMNSKDCDAVELITWANHKLHSLKIEGHYQVALIAYMSVP